MTDSPVFSPLVLSTDNLPAEDRFEACSEIFKKGIGRVELSTDDRRGFRASIQMQPLPNLVVLQTTLTSCSLMRTPALLRDGDDCLVFGVCLTGTGEMRFGEDRARFSSGSGTASLVGTHRCGGFFTATGATTYSVRIERQVVRSFASSFEEAMLRELRPSDPSLTILKAYIGALLSQRQSLSPSMATLVDGQLRELLAHLLNPAGDLARSAPYGGVKAARLRAILNDITAHIGDTTLNAMAVGSRLGLSARYVQQIVEGAGLSFSEHVRNLRLDRAKRLLADPRCAHLRIGDICGMAGFNSLSHFNRRFRARFGETPTRARRS
jgi:AraC-like DNA-binding protein